MEKSWFKKSHPAVLEYLTYSYTSESASNLRFMQSAPLGKIFIEAQNGLYTMRCQDFSGTTACTFIVFIIKVIFWDYLDFLEKLHEIRKFIVLEGADDLGSPLSQRPLLSGYNTLGAGLSAVMIPFNALGRFCTGRFTSPQRGSTGSRGWNVFYMASRAQLVREVIQPALRNGDRGNIWSVPYEQYCLSRTRQGLDIKAIRKTGEIATCGIHPDSPLFLILISIQHQRGWIAPDRLESRGDVPQKVQSGYRIEAQSERTILIDATVDKEKVHTEIITRPGLYFQTFSILLRFLICLTLQNKKKEERVVQCLGKESRATIE